ncbi:Wadjet anti-phage system protein JetD domain-containing protein [Arcobacter peruensis]|uniref:Wadjet anti-phage system protein JetD domain-containing protein n=1 Tax=Arcobacter peruensis TaxID=2320140 RepID=UPI000F07777D|nr:Wadjet anti-phage system protein JetD domain-containing protein [Arcobacter peruensis]
MLRKEEIEKVLSSTICKEIIIYFLNIINKRDRNITTPAKLSLNPNTQTIKKCLTLLYCPENINEEIEAEKQIEQCINLNIFTINYKDKRHTFPLYKRKAMLIFNDDFEYQFREVLNMTISLYKNEWIEAIDSSQIPTQKKDIFKNLTPIVYKGKTAKEIINRVEGYLLLNRQDDFIREASAFIFFGHSKILDSRNEYWDILNIVQQPIQILVFASKENLTNILFIENKQTFESLKNKKSVTEKNILIFLSGFMGTAERLKDEKYRSFYFQGTNNINYKEKSLHKIFDEQESFKFYLWGDLDYEGINIYLALKKTFLKVKPWKYAYDIMIKQLLGANGHDAFSAEKENQKKPSLTGDDYIDCILIPTMDQYGFFDQEGVLL